MGSKRKDIAVRQSIPKELRYTINDFNREFPSDDACLQYIQEQRFPGGLAHCPKCEKERRHYRVSGRTAYACDHCGHHMYPLAGTIFEKSSTSLRAWFYAMYLMGSTRCGISAKQIQRETGVTYKTAWRIFHQIRTLLSEDLQLEGPSVEMDETYFGGRTHGKGRGLHLENKTPIVGIVERKGRVMARVTPKVNAHFLMGMAREHIVAESTVYTDEFSAYDRLPRLRDEQGRPLRYSHRQINHSAKVYVIGDIHTNSVDGFWSLIKRGIGGVYHSVGRKYLQSYLDEYGFRYNRRDQGNLIFKSILERASELAG
ncbi:MAG: IS1595 family transposase [Bryobacteraceae bacterium]